jgi:hypothetical protein
MNVRGSRPRLSRRTLLLAALGGGGGMLALAGGRSWWVTGRLARRRLAAAAAVPTEVADAATRVGEAFLSYSPMPSETDLWSSLGDRLAPWVPGGLQDPAFRARVQAAIEADFAAENTVALDGVFVARTGAELCALFALSRSRAEAAPDDPSQH